MKKLIVLAIMLPYCPEIHSAEICGKVVDGNGERFSPSFGAMQVEAFQGDYEHSVMWFGSAEVSADDGSYCISYLPVGMYFILTTNNRLVAMNVGHYRTIVSPTNAHTEASLKGGGDIKIPQALPGVSTNLCITIDMKNSNPPTSGLPLMIWTKMEQSITQAVNVRCISESLGLKSHPPQQ